MEIVLHIGAHRTATTSFQAYMRGNAPGLAQGGVAFWGPLRTRNGLFSGLWAPVQPSPKAGAARVAGRVALALARVENSGARVLVISDENILGQPCAMLRDGRAYPHAAARAGALQRAFGGRIGAVGLGGRSPEMWWPSLVAMAVGRGHPMPDARACARMAAGSLDWAGLAQALHLAMGCPVGLLAHELCAHAPDRRLAAMLSMLPGAAVAPLALPSPAFECSPPLHRFWPHPFGPAAQRLRGDAAPFCCRVCGPRDPTEQDHARRTGENPGARPHTKRTNT